MIDFCVVDAEGIVVQSGSVQDGCLRLLDIPEGGRLVPGVKARMGDKKEKVLEDGALVELDEDRHTLGYQMRRRNEYPQIGDQLEAIWDALDAAGVALPAKAQDLKQQIAEVKQRHPKVV